MAELSKPDYLQIRGYIVIPGSGAEKICWAKPDSRSHSPVWSRCTPLNKTTHSPNIHVFPLQSTLKSENRAIFAPSTSSLLLEMLHGSVLRVCQKLSLPTSLAMIIFTFHYTIRSFFRIPVLTRISSKLGVSNPFLDDHSNTRQLLLNSEYVDPDSMQ